MLNSANISEEAKSIVSKFIRQESNNNIFVEHSKMFIVSLYATMPQAQTERGDAILTALTEYDTDLLDFVTIEELKVLHKEYAAVIQYCYEQIDKTGLTILSLSGYIGRVPKEIVDLCLSISAPQEGSTVYLPFAGESQFGYYLPNCVIEGFEPFNSTWAFSQILLDSKNINSNIDNCELDTISHVYKKQFDYIFTAPPLFTGKDLRPIVNALYDFATKALSPNGEIYCILPMAFCNASTVWFALRKVLIDYHGLFSAAVISFPKGILKQRPNDAICLFCLFKDHKNRVMLVDASSSEFLSEDDIAGNKKFDLDVKTILETIEKQDSKHMWVGYSTELSDFLNLTPSRYLVKQHLPQPKKGERIMQLSQLIDVVPRTKLGPDEEHQLIDFKSLSSQYLNCGIISSAVHKRDVKVSGMGIRKIECNECLLAGYFGKKMRVGKLSGYAENETVAIPRFIIPFRIKSNGISEDYLLRCILSVDTLCQIAMFNSSTNEKTFEKDFLNISIIVPSLDEQERICKEDTTKNLDEADRKLAESAEEFRRDIHIKKHAIGQTISNFNNWWNILNIARKQGNGVLRDTDVIGGSIKFEVSEIFENLQQIISQLQTQISRFDRGNGLIAREILLSDFISNYVKTHKNPLFEFSCFVTTVQSFSLDDQESEKSPFSDEMITDLDEGDTITIGVDGPFERVLFSPDALTIIFDNIISNACSHGFYNKDPKQCSVKIELSKEGSDHIIIISNNGEPIPDEMSHDDVFRYGKSSKPGKNHYGIGGYEIKQLMNQFDGDVSFISTPDDEYTVSYRLVFHSTII